MFDLENKIKDNLAYFNDQEPEQGHKTRFISRLKNTNTTKSKKIQLYTLAKIAAAFLLLIATSYLIVTISNKNSNDNSYITQILYSEELNKVQTYYDELTMTRLNQIDEYAQSEEESERLKVKAQNKLEKLDANLAAIEKEYMKNPQCEKLNAAIVSNKKMKVTVVDNLIEQLDNAQRGYHAGSMFTNY
ncbi:MAG: hypothetical protein H8E34_03285 [Bacteroidetes bacterium]|nr:hypothetical protein [Bacteroidota bacterium]MBL6942959.1 hypothetical protein [Bacteroidales bacterium]